MAPSKRKERDDSFVVSDGDEDVIEEGEELVSHEDRKKGNKKGGVQKKTMKKEEEDSSPKKKKKASSKKAPEETTTYPDGWTVCPAKLLYRKAQGGQISRTKVAGFDLDGTLLRPRTNISPKDANDFHVFSNGVVPKLKELHKDGFAIVVFSNQGGIKGSMLGVLADKLRAMFVNVQEHVNKEAGMEIPMHCLMATDPSDTEYRKPGRGMWDVFVKEMNDGVEPDLGASFFVGDAAGREGDINNGSASDKEFAERIGIKFMTPEETFGEQPNAAMAKVFFDIADLFTKQNDFFKARAFKNSGSIILDFPKKVKTASDLKGIKGIGKSTLAKVEEFLSTGTVALLEELKGPVAKVEQSEEAKMAMKFL